MEVLIDRALWQRGTVSSFLDEDERSCAIGHALIEWGLPQSRLLHLGGLDEIIPEMYPWLKSQEFNPFCELVDEEYSYDETMVNTKFVIEAIEINDAQVNMPPSARQPLVLSEQDREAQLTALFDKNGITLQFIGENDATA